MRCLLPLLLLAGCSLTGQPADSVVPPGLGTARAAWEADSDSEWNCIWYGRRTAYTGDYAGAVEIYSQGLEEHPDSARLLRHRGHRYISLRDFPSAVADLQRAAELVAGTEDEVEQDGMPNALGIPTSTLHGNVHYHLALAHYCLADFAAAQRSWAACLATARNPDMECAARYWLYHAATRGEDPEAAAYALEPVRADWEVIENHVYHRLLLLYRGELDRGEVVGNEDDALDDATLRYGIARWEAMHGEAARAELLLRDLAREDSAAFGVIAAEADLARGD